MSSAVSTACTPDTALAAEVCAKTALLLGSQQAPAYLAANSLGWWVA